eukprot:Nk52_evm5s349 gene=Nk52_evmTU5s349
MPGNSMKVDKIPYPEFLQFKIELDEAEVYGRQPVSGHVVLELSTEHPNLVKDVVVECVAMCDVKHVNYSSESISLLQLTQRGACPFDNEGMPAGKYEFPFSFLLPDTLPSTIQYSSYYGENFFSKMKLIYQIRAYIIPIENATMTRKCLRIHHHFYRYSHVDATPGVKPFAKVDKKVNFGKDNVTVTASAEKDTYAFGENIRVESTIERTGGKLIKSVEFKMYQLVKTCQRKADGEVKKTNAYSFVCDSKLIALNKQGTDKKKTVVEASLCPLYVPGNCEGASPCVHTYAKSAMGNPKLFAPSTMIRSKYGDIEISYFVEVTYKYGGSFSSMLSSSSVTCRLNLRMCDRKPNGRPNLPLVIDSRGVFKGMAISCDSLPESITLNNTGRKDSSSLNNRNSITPEVNRHISVLSLDGVENSLESGPPSYENVVENPEQFIYAGQYEGTHDKRLSSMSVLSLVENSRSSVSSLNLSDNSLAPIAESSREHTDGGNRLLLPVA